MKKIVLPLIIALLVFLTIAPCYVLAQEGISTSCDTEIDFPNSLTLYLEANSTVDISRIILRYRVDRISTVKVTSIVDKKFDQAPSVKTHWNWDMLKSSSLPVGADVEYSWYIEDISGDTTETDWKTIEFHDDRYEWNKLKGGNITLLWYRGGPAFSHELMDAAHDALAKLSSNTGAQLEEPIDIYIYASSSDLRDAFVYPQEWMGGAAFNEHGIVAIGIAPEDLAWGKRAMTHELTHLVTYQMTSNPYNDIPTWLNEGLSMYAEGELDSTFIASLEEAIEDDELISVQTLSSNFPADLDEAYLSYAQSQSLVQFLIDTSGRNNMLSLLDTFKHGSSYDGALAKVYGFDSFGLDNLWRKNLGLEPRPEPIPPLENEVTPTPTPGNGFFGCQSASGDTRHSSLPLFGVAGLLLLPGISELIRMKTRRGRK